MDKEQNPSYHFDINRADLYEYGQSKDRTKKRLIEIAELGMRETGTASFGYIGAMSGLFIEKIWYYSDEKFESYMNWVRQKISETQGGNMNKKQTLKSFYNDKGFELTTEGLKASKQMSEAIGEIYSEWLDKGYSPSECREMLLTEVMNTSIFQNAMRS